MPAPAPLDDEDHTVAASLLQFGVAPTSHTSPLPVAGPSSQVPPFVYPTPPSLGLQPPSGSVPVPLLAPQYAPWAVAPGLGSDGDVSTKGTSKSLEVRSGLSAYAESVSCGSGRRRTRSSRMGAG